MHPKLNKPALRQLYQFGSGEIQLLLKKARRVIKHPSLHILLAPAATLQGRIVVITSRKVGNAPARNTVRRRLKSIFYEQNLYSKGFDCLVIIKKDAKALTFQDLKNILFMAFQLPIKSP